MRMEDGTVDVKQSHSRWKVEQARADQHQNARLWHRCTTGKPVIAVVGTKQKTAINSFFLNLKNEFLKNNLGEMINVPIVKGAVGQHHGSVVGKR